MKYDIENSLRKYMPSLIKLLGTQKIKWASINGNLQSYIEKAKEEHQSTGQVVQRDATFYSIIIRKISGKGDTDGMFDFFNKTCESLMSILTETEKKPLHRMISKVLLMLDYRYLNFIGELATLNKFMETCEYELINIEEPISSNKGTSADLFLKRKKDNIEVLIEVLNLHIEIQEFVEFADFEYYLNSKLKNKIKEKLINPNRIIFIQPVLWTKDLKQLQFICDFYSKTNFTIENVIIPMSYLTYKHSDGRYEHRFESIMTILKD
jgi:hypothetical protein